MFKDISLTINKDRIEYEYNLEEKQIRITTTDQLIKDEILRIFYDDNIYEIIIPPSTSLKEKNGNTIDIEINEDNLSFYVIIKENYLVKTIYKYINNFLDKDKLLKELNLFKTFYKEYNDDIDNLIELLHNENNNDNICNLLINNQTYQTICSKMTDYELMLLITSYISVPNPPKIDQEKFNDLIEAAYTGKDTLENEWRLAMNYDEKGFNYELLDEYFLNSNNSWYIGEYILSTIQIDQGQIIDKLIDKIVNTNNKTLLKQLLNDDFFMTGLKEENANKLKKLMKKED